MRIGLILVILLSLAPFSSAGQYCHEDNCFTNRGYINLDEEDLYVYYNSLFTIGKIGSSYFMLLVQTMTTM